MPFVVRGDVPLWWSSRGKGEPVLLISGLSSPSDVWFRLARRLAPRFEVLTFDNRGVGRTGVPPGPYSVETMAADAVAVLDAAGADRAHVLGISMGGMIAQELALTAPERTLSLVLAATHPGVAHAVDADPVVVEQLVQAAGLSAADRLTALVSLFYARTTSQVDIDADCSVRNAHPTSESGYRNQLLGTTKWGRLADLGRLAVPTMILHGAEDRLVPPGNGRLLAEAIPDAQLTILPNAAHQVFTDQEQRAADLVIAFLSGVRRPALSSDAW